MAQQPLNVIDVTDVYWRFVDLIVQMEYHELQRTHLFEFMSSCVLDNRGFALRLHDTTLLHTNVSELFYNTLSFLELRGDIVLEYRLQKAITKIESVVAAMEEDNAMKESIFHDDDRYDDGPKHVANDFYISELDELLMCMAIC